jgi:threonyl-tRNA synthetase
MNDLQNLRHSLAHLLAAAVEELYPDAKRTIGPAIENGFYYDFDFPVPISDKDLKDIEKKMKRLLPTWKEFVGTEVSVEEAREKVKGNEYKLELINELEVATSPQPSPQKERGPITFYKSGNFEDLCRGGHTEDLSKIDPESFCLQKIAGAYWRGDEKNKMLTRIYGLAFSTKEELSDYLKMQEEAEKRDHRKLGASLDLFTFDEEIGKGLPIWLPKGNLIKEALEDWAKKTETERGYQRVTTPIITKENLFFTSGHLPLYKDSMYAPISIEDENYYIKPMNCPFHHKVFSARPRSYRELPLRIAEYGWCHRYEDSGSLFGLMRVRGMQMNDAHIYASMDNAIEEFVNVIKLHEYYYKHLGINKYEMELALRDPNNMNKYHGEESDWKLAEKMTIEAMEKSGVPYKVVQEGAAFYGPKMDFQIYSSTGRMFTASTNQLDLYMGKRFKLEYTDKEGNTQTPVIIHRAPLGTHERFIGFLIEHFGGNFPLWLSPVQIAILPIGEGQVEYANKVAKQLRALSCELRVEIDPRSESIGKKIREQEKQKTPYMLILGAKEQESGTLSLRGRGEKDLGVMSVEEFSQKIREEIEKKI